MDILDINGSHIRKLRDDLGWTREFLSGESGVPVGTIQDIEAGVSKNPGLETLKKLILALPNYTHEDKDRDRLILDIQARLTALDYDELGTVSSAIDDLISIRPEQTKATRAK